MNSYIIENFMNEEQEKKIHDLTIDQNFPWFYFPGTVIEVEEGVKGKCVYDEGINPFQFVHVIDLNECSFTEVIAPVFNQLSIEFQSNIRIIRSKFNFLPKNTDSTHHYPHVDHEEKDLISAIYYVNDSDGDTHFFDEELNITNKITPKKGRMVLFDSNKFHSSSSPINNQNRIVLNTVFKLLSEES